MELHSGCVFIRLAVVLHTSNCRSIAVLMGVQKEEGDNVKMASFPICAFVSGFSSFLALVFMRSSAAASSDSLIFVFLPLPKSVPLHCCRSGKVYERTLRWCYFGVLPLLCPPPSCHNMEFWEEKLWKRAEHWHQNQVHFNTLSNSLNRMI